MKPTSLLLHTLPDSPGLSLRDRVCEAISSAIVSRSVAIDRPLPSCRELAAQLGVSRNTVFAAYTRLIDMGFLIARDRSGYFVNPDTFKNLPPVTADQEVGVDAPSPVRFPPSDLIPLTNPLDWTSYPFPFIYNQIDPDLFPVDGWRECSRLALGRKGCRSGSAMRLKATVPN